MRKTTMFAPDCCRRCYGTGWVKVLRAIMECAGCGGTGRVSGSAYDTLPSDSKPAPETILNDAGPVGDDTPISGEPK